MKRVRTREGDKHSEGWAVVGELGAMEFWMFTPLREYGGGGVEAHLSAPRGYKHEHCDILNAPCWHDGTSLWASEHWIPMYQACGEEWVYQELEARYADFMGE